MRSFEVGWWMNRGLRSASSLANSSTGISYCAVSGSSDPNVSEISSRANSMSANDAGVAEYTNS